jgi:hypothetical protein
LSKSLLFILNKCLGPHPSPPPQLISNALSKRGPVLELDPIPHSMFSVIFGQFINHDFQSNVFGPNSMAEFMLPQYIPKDDGDSQDTSCNWPLGFGVMWLPSVNICSDPSHPVAWGLTSPSIRIPTGTVNAEGKKFYNIINNSSAWLDLNTVYGTDSSTAAALRDPSGGGRLRMEDYEVQVLLPLTASLGPPGLVPDFANGAAMRNYSGRGWLPSAETTGRNMWVMRGI